LTLDAGGDILLVQDGKKSFRFMFTWQMRRQSLKDVAISPESDAVIALCLECKVFASNDFPKAADRFVRTRLANVIHEQPFVY
jgi:hypothetical protein